jgi:hypothetical protein
MKHTESGTSKETKYKQEKLLSRSKTDPNSTRCHATLTMTTKGARSWSNQTIRKCANRSHFRLYYTHINHLYTIPSIVGGILQSREHEHINYFLLFPLYILDFYNILFYAIYLSILFIQFFTPPTPIFGALGRCPVCPVVKPAVKIPLINIYCSEWSLSL